jgi:hypothetical protein
MLRRINVKALGLAFGFTWAGGIFVLGFAASFDYGIDLVNFIAKLYIGYEPTLTGSLIGALWAFTDAFLGGAAVAWLYNKFSEIK